MKKAEKLNQDTREVKISASKAVEEANRKVEAAREERDRALSQTARDRKAAAEERRSAERYKAEQEQLKRDELKLIDQSADEKIKAEKARLQRDNEISKAKAEKRYKDHYKAQEIQHYAIYIFCAAWCVIQAVFSPKVIADISQIVSWIAKYAVTAWGWIISWSNGVASLTSGISNETVATVLYWVVGILIGILLAAVFYVVVMIGPIYVSWLYFISEYFDKFNKRFMVVTGVIWIVASSLMPELSANYFLIWIAAQILIVILKGIEKWYCNKSGYEQEEINRHIISVLIIVGGIAFVVLLTHFLYGWWW